MMARLGLCASTLCAVHCLAMPFVLAAQPVFVWLRLSRVVDNALLALAAVVGVLVCASNHRRHRDWGPLGLLLLGLTAVFVGRYFGLRPLTMGGPLVMSYGLWLNRRLCPCHACHHE
jgi:hypothetical protein